METEIIQEKSDMQLSRYNDSLKMMPIEQAKQWYNQFAEFTKSILKKDMDYGVIPGTPKPALLKAGAEKLRFVYGLGVEFEMIDKMLDLEKPYVDYTYRCTVRSKAGQILSQCEGNCNSLEAKFGYVWLPLAELPDGADTGNLRSRANGRRLQEFDFAISKAETTGPYAKSAEYWNKWKDAIKNGSAKRVIKKSKTGKEMEAWELDDTITLYRVPNPEVLGLKNNIMKMAQKRAFVGAVLIATGASEFFTQDIEDMFINGKIYSDEHPVEATTVADTIVEEEAIIKVEPVKEAELQPSLQTWVDELHKCKTKQEMLMLYSRNRKVVDVWPELQKLFTLRKQEYLNEMVA